MKNSVHDLRAERVYQVDLKLARSKKSLLEALATGLKLPSHFGHNWDALADCLMDARWAKTATTTVLLYGTASAETRFGQDWATLREILDEACIWWGEHDKVLRVVLV
jgi:RNAse (barnase) inhibitor barstar